MNPETLPGVRLIAESKNYKVYTCHNPESLAKLAEGTNLCTHQNHPDGKKARNRFATSDPASPFYTRLVFRDNQLYCGVCSFICVDGNHKPIKLDTELVALLWPDAAKRIVTAVDFARLPTDSMAWLLVCKLLEGQTMRNDTLQVALNFIRKNEPNCPPDLLQELERKLRETPPPKS